MKSFLQRMEKRIVQTMLPQKMCSILFLHPAAQGTPKGVQITRDCLDNFIKWALCLGSGTAQEKVYTFMNQAPFSFDLSVMDLYLCLYTGGTLFALGKNVQVDLKLLYEALRRSGINKWISTPSFADVCLADRNFWRASSRPYGLPVLRRNIDE